VIAEGTSPNHPQQPQLMVDESGVVHVAFGVNNNVKYSRSEDGGKKFTAPVTLPTVDVMSLGMRRGPRVAVSGRTVCISVIGGKQGKGRDGDVLVFRSNDNGQTWQGPVAANDKADSAREGLHGMASGPKGELCCVWLDLRDDKTEVYSSISRDAGETWSENVLAYRSPGGSVCECCHPSVTISTDGKIHVLFRNSLHGKRDMYLTTSSDGGKSFGKADKLGTGSWTFDHCPMDGGSLTVLKDKDVATIWRRDKQIYFTKSAGAKEIELGTGEQPCIAGSNEGPIAVWLRKRGGPLHVRLPGSTTPLQLAPAAGDPSIAVGGPKKDVVVVAWEERSGKDTSIVCQRLRNRD